MTKGEFIEWLSGFTDEIQIVRFGGDGEPMYKSIEPHYKIANETDKDFTDAGLTKGDEFILV